MRVASVARYAVSSVASIVVAVSSLSGPAGVAHAQDEDDPWFDAAVGSGIGRVSAPAPIERGDVPRQITVDTVSAPVGSLVVIHHVGFSPGERIVEWTYKYQLGCPDGHCWKRVYVDEFVVDQWGNYDFPWDTNGVAPGIYRFCTGGIVGCRRESFIFGLTSALP